MHTIPTALSAKRLAAVAGLAAALLAVPALPVLADEAAAGQDADGQAAAASAEPTPSTLAEDELDTVVGSYTYQGVAYDITAREVIEATSSLSAMLNDDGTYTAPTAEMVLDYARNRIVAVLADEAGIEVSDEELAAYAEQYVGTSDFATLASYYQMDEEQARAVVLEAATAAKLRDEVVGSVGDAPQPPVAPDDGDTEAETAEYAAYVLELVGSNWDAENQTWANTDNAYYQALYDVAFDGTQASYQTAQTAYYVAYSLYQQQVSEQRSAWTQYVNGHLAQATISIGTLRS